MRLERKEIIEIISSIAILAGGIYAFGKFNGRLDQLEKRVDGLEVRVDPLRQLRVGKGDLCLKMLEQLGNVPEGKRGQEVQERWDRSGCEYLPVGALVANKAEANATMNSN